MEILKSKEAERANQPKLESGSMITPEYKGPPETGEPVSVQGDYKAYKDRVLGKPGSLFEFFKKLEDSQKAAGIKK